MVLGTSSSPGVVWKANSNKDQSGHHIASLETWITGSTINADIFYEQDPASDANYAKTQNLCVVGYWGSRICYKAIGYE